MRLLILFCFNTITCFFVIHDQIGNRGVVTEASGFNAEADAATLREAMKGAGE